jgi:hypothetical protein
MQDYLILTGTEDQIQRSNTLKAIVDNSESIQIINWRDDAPIEIVFNPVHFSIATTTVLVCTNNAQLNFTEFFLYHQTHPLYYNSKIEFVFICRNNPFEQTTEITKRFKVVDVVKKDGELNAYNFSDISIYTIDAKIKRLLQLIEECKASTVFCSTQKTMFCDFYKKMIMQQHVLRLEYADYSAQEIINSINVKV